MLDPARRAQALAHRAWAPRHADSYERLELLGDSVLGLVITEELMRRHPQATAGDLTWMRQSIVSREACAAAAREAGLAAAMVATAPHGARTDARRLAPKPSIQAQLAEAVIGGAWLDLGREATTAGVLEAFGEAIAGGVPGQRDPKSALQEEAASRGLPVAYELTAQRGPAHARTFASRAMVGGRQLGEGSGSSKQASEIAAAIEALEALRAEDPT